MSNIDVKLLGKLDKEDKEKISYFVRLLARQSKYRKLKEAVSERREEIKRGEALSHEDIWEGMDV